MQRSYALYLTSFILVDEKGFKKFCKTRILANCNVATTLRLRNKLTCTDYHSNNNSLITIMATIGRQGSEASSPLDSQLQDVEDSALQEQLQKTL